MEKSVKDKIIAHRLRGFADHKEDGLSQRLKTLKCSSLTLDESYDDEIPRNLYVPCS
jgi:hypothetical protein